MIQVEDIVKSELCTGCGVCVSESEGNLSMHFNSDGFLVPQAKQVIKNNAAKVCPFNPQPDKEVATEDELANQFLTTSMHTDPRMGKYISTYVGYAKEYRATSSSGGIATHVFKALLEQKIVDHLFIVKEVAGTYAYQWFDNMDDIESISKTRYIPVTLENLFLEIDAKKGKVAVSGVACFIKAIRLKQHYNPEYKEKISFLIGIICGGLKSKFFTDYLAQKAGIIGEYNKQEYRIKDIDSTAIDYSFGAYDTSADFHQVKMKTVGDMWGTGLFKSRACDFCDDVTTELADISLGDAWLAPYNKEGEGTSVIVTRSVIAEELIRIGIKDLKLAVEVLAVERFKASQEGSFKHRQKAIAYRLSRLQKENGWVPYKRKRLHQAIPFEFKAVQKQRMLLRKESNACWRTLKDAKKFEEKISPLKIDLTKKTNFYHRLQHYRKRLHFKTL